MASTTTYDYSNLQINGTTPTAVYANGTQVLRMIVNGTDVIHKTTVATQTISVSFSFQVDATYETSGGCTPSNDVKFSNAKLLYSVNRGDLSAGLYVTQIKYSGYYSLDGNNTSNQTVTKTVSNANESGSLALNSYDGWLNDDDSVSFVPHFTLTITYSDGSTATVSVPSVSITTSGSPITTVLTTHSKTFTKTTQEY